MWHSEWISNKFLQCKVQATDPSRSFRRGIVKALKNRANNPKCDQEQKARAAKVCDMIENWTKRSKDEFYAKELKNVEKCYDGKGICVDLRMDFFEPQVVGFKVN